MTVNQYRLPFFAVALRDSVSRIHLITPFVVPTSALIVFNGVPTKNARIGPAAHAVLVCRLFPAVFIIRTPATIRLQQAAVLQHPAASLVLVVFHRDGVFSQLGIHPGAPPVASPRTTTFCPDCSTRPV